MRETRRIVINLLLLSVVCESTVGSQAFVEDLMDPVLELLLQEELVLDDMKDKDVAGGSPQLVGQEWLCGACADRRPDRVLYSELTDVMLDQQQYKYAEFQVGIALTDKMSCVTVSGASALQVLLLDGSCLSSAVALALKASDGNSFDSRRAYSIFVRAYGE